MHKRTKHSNAMVLPRYFGNVKIMRCSSLFVQLPAGNNKWGEPSEEGLHVPHLCQGVQQLHESVHAQEDQASQHRPSWLHHIYQWQRHGPSNPYGYVTIGLSMRTSK